MFVSCGKFQARELSFVCHTGDNSLFIRESLKRAFIQFLFCHATDHEIGKFEEFGPFWGKKNLKWLIF